MSELRGILAPVRGWYDGDVACTDEADMLRAATTDRQSDRILLRQEASKHETFVLLLESFYVIRSFEELTPFSNKNLLERISQYINRVRSAP